MNSISRRSVIKPFQSQIKAPFSHGKHFRLLDSYYENPKKAVYEDEFKSARKLQVFLGFDEWSFFMSAMKKSENVFRQLNRDPGYHFLKSYLPVKGNPERKEVIDYYISHLACYILSQSGDIQNPQVVKAQKKFAIQPIINFEGWENMRDEIKEAFKSLSYFAQKAGVRNELFGVFHDAGYRGLYGRGVERIKARKELGFQNNLTNSMPTIELALNLLRIKQAEEMILSCKSESEAIKAHESAGLKIRLSLMELKRMLPENFSVS